MGLYWAMIVPQFFYKTYLLTKWDIIFPVAAGTITILNVLNLNVARDGGSQMIGVIFVRCVEHLENKEWGGIDELH